MVFESDHGVNAAGDVLSEIHKSLDSNEPSIPQLLEELVSPASKVAEAVLAVASTALEPVAKLLQSKKDKYIALCDGYFPALAEDWGLRQERNEVAVEYLEIFS